MRFPLWRRRRDLNLPPVPEITERAEEIATLKVQYHHAQARTWATILRTEEVVAENHFAANFRKALRQ